MNIVRWWRIRQYRCIECGERLDADGVCPEVARQRAEWRHSLDVGIRPIQAWPTAEGQP